MKLRTITGFLPLHMKLKMTYKTITPHGMLRCTQLQTGSLCSQTPLVYSHKFQASKYPVNDDMPKPVLSNIPP